MSLVYAIGGEKRYSRGHTSRLRRLFLCVLSRPRKMVSREKGCAMRLTIFEKMRASSGCEKQTSQRICIVVLIYFPRCVPAKFICRGPRYEVCKSWQRDFASPWHDQILSGTVAGCGLVKFIGSVSSSIVLNSVDRIVGAIPWQENMGDDPVAVFILSLQKKKNGHG